MGYADTGFTGVKDFATPNIDALVHDGVICTNGYATAPVCSPSRAGFITGRYETRFGHERNPLDTDDPTVGLPVEQKTIADVMKASVIIRAPSANGIWAKRHIFSPTRAASTNGSAFWVDITNICPRRASRSCCAAMGRTSKKKNTHRSSHTRGAFVRGSQSETAVFPLSGLQRAARAAASAHNYKQRVRHRITSVAPTRR